MQTLAPAIDLGKFREEGYCVVRGLLDLEEDLRPIEEEYEALLDSVADELHAAGKLSSTFRGLPFGQRLTKIVCEGQEIFQHLDIGLPPHATADTPIHVGPAIFNLLRSPRLLDAVECFIGPEIFSNPVQHARIKPPERLVPPALRNSMVVAVGWHQDMGVVDLEADDTNMLSVWVAITDATPENGCLQVIPGSHKRELQVHCSKNIIEGLPNLATLAIPDKLLGPGARPVPMRAGDVLFFQKKMIHSSLPNNSDGIRWSFDLRYNPIGQPTGRPWLPGFVARSRSHPETEFADPKHWAQLWHEARARLASSQDNRPSGRWNSTHPLCA
jgi:hypothetical protein